MCSIDAETPVVKMDSPAEEAEEVDLTADEDGLYQPEDANHLGGIEEDYYRYPQQFFLTTPPASHPYSLSFHQHHHPGFANSPSTTQSGIFESSSPSSVLHSISASKTLLVNFDDLKLPLQKMSFLKSVPVNDLEKLFEKGTAESKILTSVFYDFGKSLSAVFRLRDDSKSPEEHLAFSKSFLNANLDVFLKQFPNLQLESLNNVRVHDMTPVAFLRLSARNGFKRGLKR